MKIKFIGNKDSEKKVIDEIEKGNFNFVNNDEDYYLIEKSFNKDSLVGKLDEDFVILSPIDIIYVESFGSEVYVVTANNRYLVKEKLYEIEAIFHDQGFIRVHKSFVINKKHIKSIRASFNMKYIVTMEGNYKIEVSRSYYYKFKEYIGF